MTVEWVGVAVGGLFGAVTRFFVMNLVNKYWSKSFPIATFFINVIGSVLLGMILSLSIDNQWLDNWLVSIFGLGFMGAFTTFSTLMYESVTLMDRRLTRTAVLYVGASVVFGILGALVGRLLS